MLQGSTGSDRAIQEYCSVLQRATGVLQSIARYDCRVLCRGVPDSAEDCRNTTNDHRHATGENYGLRQSTTKNYTALRLQSKKKMRKTLLKCGIHCFMKKNIVMTSPFVRM